MDYYSIIYEQIARDIWEVYAGEWPEFHDAVVAILHRHFPALARSAILAHEAPKDESK